MDRIKTAFLYSAGKLQCNSTALSKLWQEIEANYADPKRHYHTLSHLDHLLTLLLPYQSRFKNWDTVIFAIVYHDIIYNTLKGNNEEKSAELAAERLRSLNAPPAQIAGCRELILATKRHEVADEQTNLFTDADLAILGADADVYRAYAQNIRREYAVFPDLVYNAGRRNILQHFLTMPKIYKTSEFSRQFESKARKNLQSELSSFS